jgi:hypothetical protein
MSKKNNLRDKSLKKNQMMILETFNKINKLIKALQHLHIPLLHNHLLILHHQNRLTLLHNHLHCLSQILIKKKKKKR